MAEINGTSGNDTIAGTIDADIINAGDGIDKVTAGKGDDIVYAGAGNDTVSGDEGNDQLFGGLGNDALIGHSGKDKIYGEDGNDAVYGGGDADSIWGASGNDTLIGDGGDDTIYGEADNDKLYGGVGNDTLYGGMGVDTLNGDAGNDTLVVVAGEGSDTVVGGAGFDTIVLDVTSGDVTAAFRADIAAYDAWMQGLIETYGQANLAAQTTGASFTFASVGLTISLTEGLTVRVDGVPTPISEFLNTAPTADAIVSVETNEDTVLSGQVVATDAEGDVLAYALSEGPAHGSVTLNTETGAYEYTPAGDYSGNDAFVVTVTDPSGASVTQRVEIAVAAIADLPALTVANSLGNATAVANGNGTVAGGSGADTLVGGQGNDKVSGNSGNDVIYGDGGPNVTVGLSIAASLSDLDGSETLSVTISGVPAGATMSAGQDNGDGSWTLSAGDLAGLSMTVASADAVTLTVTATATESSGAISSVTKSLDVTFDTTGEGNDTLSGGNGNDTIYGGGGNDILYGGTGEDDIDGGSGNDTMNGQSNDDTLFGGAGNDSMWGGTGNDVMDGGTGNDTLSGGGGNDTFLASEGNDTYSGASGIDVLDYSGAASGVTVDASKKTVTGYGSDKFSNIEHIIGSGHDDTFKGSSGSDTFTGGAGNDTFRGMEGSDTFTGGAGNDTWQWFVKDVIQGNNHKGVDTITDLGSGDRLDLTEFTKAFKNQPIDNIVHVTDTTDGSMLSVKIGNAFVDLVMLEGVHGVDGSDLLDDGMILA